MPKEPPVTGSSRQRPISCRFCRTRKLRCSREAPCTNCTSRGIECDLETIVRPSAANTNGPSHAELLERVRTLENLLQNTASDGHTLAYASPTRSGSCSVEAKKEIQVRRDVDGINSDVKWLSSIYDGTKRAPDELPPDKVVFRICAIQKVLESSRSHYVEPSSVPGAWPRKVFWLPQHVEAAALIDKFWRHVEHTHHVFYEPHIRSLADRIYMRLTQAEHIKSGEMILLLAVLASATRSWTEEDCQDDSMFSSTVEAHAQAEFWSREAENLLDIARRTTRVSIEGVQAAIVLMFVPEDLEGFWRRCRGLHSSAILMSRELGLHAIDVPSNAHSAHTVMAEVGRRVWWHIVASDWAMASRVDDIQRGFYYAHPRHMMTRQPLNLDDEALESRINHVGKPAHEPTSMSYGLFRIRVAEVCRHIADRTPFAVLNSTGPSFDTVMDVDAEMLALLEDIPAFFRTTAADLMSKYSMNAVKAQGIERQGHILRSLLNGARCKLHLPYLGRGYNDPEYAQCRDICIESARNIIQGEQDSANSSQSAFIRYRPLGLIMSLFVACIVLLMDLCHSKGLPHLERQRSDIAKAFRLLDDLRGESKMAGCLIDSMTQILHKHQIAPPGVTPAPTQNTMKFNNQVLPNQPFPSTMMSGTNGIPTPSSQSCPMATRMDFPGRMESDEFRNEMSYFPNLAQSLDQGINIDNINWDDLFLDLESTFA